MKQSSIPVLFFSLVCVCALCAFCVVYPLWYWASRSPSSYSCVILVLAGLFFLSFLWKSFKKNGVRVFFRRFCKWGIVIGGVCGVILCVLHGRRIPALAVVVAAMLLYGTVNGIFKEKKHL